MACHEVGALRLGLMNILGIKNEAERQHELSELGNALQQPGPLCSLAEAKDLQGVKQFFESSLSLLEEKISKTTATDPQLPYLRSLLILTKKVELDLRNQTEGLLRFYKDLDEMHDFVHEIYPAD